MTTKIDTRFSVQCRRCGTVSARRRRADAAADLEVHVVQGCSRTRVHIEDDMARPGSPRRWNGLGKVTGYRPDDHRPYACSCGGRYRTLQELSDCMDNHHRRGV